MDFKTAIETPIVGNTKHYIINIVEAADNRPEGLKQLFEVIQFFDDGTKHWAVLERWIQNNRSYL